MAQTQLGRRRFPRIRTENPVHVRKLGNELCDTSAKTSSLGLGGCMFLAKEPVGYDAMVDLLISVRPKQVIEARGRVVYEALRSGSDYEVGVEFLSISEPDRKVLESIFDERHPDVG
jgi:hypothetical protein